MRSFRILCALLAMVLMLPGGMTLAEQPRVAMGRYVEVPLNTGGDWVAFAQMKGTIYGVNGSGETLLKSLDLNKDNWDELETGYDDKDAPYPDCVNGIAVAEDGTLYLSSGWAMRNGEGNHFLERIKDGKAERVQLDQGLDTDVDRVTLCALPDGELLGLSDIEAYRFSADGVTLQRYAVSGGESMAVHGNEVAICSTRNSMISILDIQSGQVLRLLPLPTKAIYGHVAYDAKGALYYLCADGLYQVTAGGTLMMQIADGRLMTVGKPSAEAWAILFDKDDNPVVVYWQPGGLSLIAYRYDEGVPTEPGTILSVFTMYDNRTLRECANRFQQQYPDVMVDIIVALPDRTAITKDDAIRTLNTELLAGKGPDVLVLDGLPVQSYLDKGVLQDLSPVVQPGIDSGALLAPIAGAFKANGAIAAVPTRFLVPSIWGEVEGMNTLSDMASFAQANPDLLPAYAIDVEPLISTFYPTCAPAWFTEDGQMDEPKMEAFLEACKAIRGQWNYEAVVQKTGVDFKRESSEWGHAFTWEWNPYNQLYGNSTLPEMWGCGALEEGTQKQVPYLLRGIDSAASPNGVLAYLKKGGFASLPGQAEGCFVPMMMMGASKGAANGDAALRFIEFALGEYSQSSDLSDGFQVNVKALDAALALAEKRDGISNVGAESWTVGLDPTRQKQLREMIAVLKVPVIPDFTLIQMIVTESTPFFDGQIDAKQAAANVCAKANAYLSE